MPQKRGSDDALSVRSADSDDKQPKKRRKKDPKAPKNPVSAYLFYVADQRVKNTGKSDGKTFAEVAKDLGKKWKGLTNEEKEVITILFAGDHSG
jgi:Neuraminidase (sialidase)